MEKEPKMQNTLKSADGTSLFYQNWLPAEPPVAALIIVHGLGEYSDRYQHVAQYFTERNLAVFALDLRGHGRSGGQRGHVERFQNYLDDVTALINFAKETTPNIPLFLMGHSMGGLIVLNYALKTPQNIAAVVSSAPGLRARMKVPGWKVTLASLMSNLAPKLSMPNGIDPINLSHDTENVAAYIADPLVHDKVSARWYTEFVNTGEWVLQHAKSMNVPTLVLQGGADPIVDPSGARDFFEGMTIADKKHIEYPNLYHEILNEPEKLTVLNDIEAWLMPRL